MLLRTGLIGLSTAVLLITLAPSHAQASRFSKAATPPPESGVEFGGDRPATVDPFEAPFIPREDTSFPPTSEDHFQIPRDAAFSLGLSLGFASYHAGDVVELLDHPLTIADQVDRVITGNTTFLAIDLMCQSIDTAKSVLKRLESIAEIAARRPFSSPLAEPPACDPIALRAAMMESSTQHINRAYYNSLIATRENWAVKLLKQDTIVAAAFRAGVNVGIAEGFSSRSTDAAAIVANALRNAQPDASLVGLNEARIQEAIVYAKPGVNMKVLHDMVMSMRLSFEATLQSESR